MSTWTAERWGTSQGSLTDYRVRNADGSFAAYVSVPDTDEGRRTVARMVAALQMETALTGLMAKGLTADDLMLLFLMGDVTSEQQEKFRPTVERVRTAREAARAALEAAKSLPETP